MRGTELSAVEKARIIAWRDENVTIKDICARSARGKTSVMKVLSEAKGLPPGGLPVRKPRSGRPRSTSKGTDKLIKREVLKNPRLTAAELKNIHPDVLRNVSVRTIQHRLQRDLDMPCRIAAQKPLLTARMVKQRMCFARQYKDWTPAQWSKVLWSDESTFSIILKGRQRVRRPSSSSRFDPRFTQKTVKHSDSVMVWGCFSGAKGRGTLFFLPKNKTMNAEQYILCLEEKLLNAYAIHEADFFMQDKAPCHSAKRTMEWLRIHNINVLEWCGNSPDLNPIENAWKIMKSRIRRASVTSLEGLKKEICRVWIQEMDADYFKKLAESMPKRLADVIKAKGQMTKY